MNDCTETGVKLLFFAVPKAAGERPRMPRDPRCKHGVLFYPPSGRGAGLCMPTRLGCSNLYEKRAQAADCCGAPQGCTCTIGTIGALRRASGAVRCYGVS